MKIGNVKSYSLVGVAAIAAAAGFGLKKTGEYRNEERKQAIEAAEYIKTNAPIEYKNILTDMDTTRVTNPYLIDKIWINSAKKLRDSLETQKQ